MESIKEILAQNPDGFSLQIETGAMNPMDDGYMVSLTDMELNSLDDATRVKRLLMTTRNTLNLNLYKTFLGGWKDESTGKYYLDLSIWVETLEEAMYLGRLFNQKAVFDIKALDSVEVKERKVAV